jgi:cytosine/adenosine deaminase-related metal-dependent hydrolase
VRQQGSPGRTCAQTAPCAKCRASAGSWGCKEGDKPTIVSVRELIEFATLQGAKTLGLESKTGSLTPGKRADVIIINLNDVNTHPSNDPVASVALIANSRNVNWVFVDGKVKKRDGKLVGVDLAALSKRMEASHAYLTKDVDAAK